MKELTEERDSVVWRINASSSPGKGYGVTFSILAQEEVTKMAAAREVLEGGRIGILPANVIQQLREAEK